MVVCVHVHICVHVYIVISNYFKLNPYVQTIFIYREKTSILACQQTRINKVFIWAENSFMQSFPRAPLF